MTSYSTQRVGIRVFVGKLSAIAKEVVEPAIIDARGLVVNDKNASVEVIRALEHEFDRPIVFARKSPLYDEVELPLYELRSYFSVGIVVANSPELASTQCRP